MPGDNHVRIISTRPTFSREQKAALGLVVAFGTLGLIFGGFYIWKHIAAPFAINYTGPRYLTSDAKETEEVRKAKLKDTDGDGVSDYDELYVYKTSPYLIDSDSDGLDDNTELSSGADPLCPEGGTCADEASDVSDDDLSDSFLADTADAYDYTADGSTSLPTGYSIEDIVAALSPEEIRAMLIESGADPTQINGINDDDLRALLIVGLEQLRDQGQLDTGTGETEPAAPEGTTETPTGQ
ncbi:MAG: hypothetical protein NUV56_03780 [Candidatus Uhrbacteria bacterium]|nr:hypothetical protein [Candidatus Uhrbacteria bacterium]